MTDSCQVSKRKRRLSSVSYIEIQLSEWPSLSPSTNNGAILPGDGQSTSTAHYVLPVEKNVPRTPYKFYVGIKFLHKLRM
jgi:hypothetical protein